MSTWMILRLSLRALLRNKMRTFLTMLGIIIGVAAVISMLAIAAGARNEVQENIAKLGTNVLFVFPSRKVQAGVRSSTGPVAALTADDLRAIRKECPAVQAVTPMVYTGVQLIYQDQNWSSDARGTSDEFPIVRNWPVAVGRFFQEDEVRAAATVCVVGKTVADKLFPGESGVGRTIRIGRIPFTVLGVLTEKGGEGRDDIVLMPFTTVMKRLLRVTNLNFALVSARSPEETELAQVQMKALLRQRHRLMEGQDDDFDFRSQVEFAQEAEQESRVFTLLLASIASVSLLVGGIGIMNIMLVSVTERIREIGIRMALGARARDIMLQFLVEAVVLSIIGGLMGIGLGYGFSCVASNWSRWPLVVSTESIVLSFGFASVVGIFFGLYPAVKASRLDPIEALRHE